MSNKQMFTEPSKPNKEGNEGHFRAVVYTEPVQMFHIISYALELKEIPLENGAQIKECWRSFEKRPTDFLK